MFNFDSMMAEFAVPLKIHGGGNDAGHYEAGEWVVDEAKPIEVNEPLIPPTTQARAQVGIGGTVEVCDMLWYSYQAGIAVNTIVEEVRTSQKYKVANTTDYGSYSNITIYGLKAVAVNGTSI